MRAIEFESSHLVEAGSFEFAFAISLVDFELIQAAGFGIGLQVNRVGLGQSVLSYQNRDWTGTAVLERKLYCHAAGLWNLPVDVDFAAVPVLHRD